MSGARAPRLLISAWAALALCCQGRVSALSLSVEPPAELPGGCLLSRRVSLRADDGSLLGQADTAERPIGAPLEPLEFEAKDDGSSPWQLQIDELDRCGALAAHYSGQVDPSDGSLLAGARWDEGAHCPIFPFERTVPKAAVYNPCIQTGCAAQIARNGCSIEVQVEDGLLCSLPNDHFEIHGRQGALESASCTNVSALEAGDGSVIAADCGASCEIQIESDSPPSLKPLPAVDPFQLIGCDPPGKRGMNGALALDGSLFLGLMGCMRLVHVDGRTGALLGSGEPAIPLLLHPPSGKLLALRSGRDLVAIDPDTLAAGPVLASIAPGLAFNRYVNAIYVAERDQLLVAGFYFDGSGEVISGLLYSVRLSKSASAAVTLYDRSDLSDVRYAQADPIWLGGDRVVLIQHLAGSHVPGFFRVGERSLATGALGPDWVGFERTGTRPSLMYDPTGHRVLVTKDGFLFGCSEQGLCQSTGQALWATKAYASLTAVPPAGMALAVISDKLIGAHRLDDLSRRRGALLTLAGPAAYYAPAVFYAQADAMIYVLSSTIERFSVP